MLETSVGVIVKGDNFRCLMAKQHAHGTAFFWTVVLWSLIFNELAIVNVSSGR
jgi:hypothetical protein